MPEVIMPKMGDAMVEGKLLQWIVADGAAVKAGDVIAEIETDKSNVEVEAEDAGVLRTLIRPGDTVPVGDVIATIGETAARPAAVVQATVAAASDGLHKAAELARPAVVSAANNGQERVKASPLARRVARENGVEIAMVIGTGPHGRIIEADITEFVAKRASAPAVRPAPAPVALPPATGSVEPIELSAMRKVIARRMSESKGPIPHFYVSIDIDMTEVMALREKLNSYDDTLTKISVNDMIVKAAAKALARVPAANVALRGDKLYPGSGIHVGIAVAIEDGLIVPVVRDADKIPLRSLAQKSKDLIKRAREKKLLPNEYSGGTFTVSNLGNFGVENFIAIIDPAQGGILAVASVLPKPVVLDDGVTIAVRQRMTATFSGDHRAMDGAVGARLVQELKRVLQNPLSLLE